MFRKGDEPIPGYRLEKFLGRGQFGEVWKATAPGGAAAALKFIDLGGKQAIREFRGVRRVKEIRHANLMPITALWMLDGEGTVLGDKLLEAYDQNQNQVQATLHVPAEEVKRAEWLVVAMLLGNKNLADRLEECRVAGQTGIPVDELLRYMEESAKGLDYLNSPQHDLGEGLVAIQHCDVKPANILLIGDAAVVCDFGLARVLTDVSATATSMVGSPAYMPPECINKKPGTHSDQYSLAVSYVELRTGTLPFQDLTYHAVLDANRSGNLDLSCLAFAEQRVIRKATQVNPDDRYPSALEMVKALRRAVEERPESKSPSRLPWIAAAALAFLCLPWIVRSVMRSTNHESPSQPPANQPPAIDPSVPSNFHEATFSLQPTDAQVKLNGQLQSTPDGKLTIKLRPDERAAVEASHPGDYRALYRQFTWEQLPNVEPMLQLEPNARGWCKQAADQIAAGDFDAAVKSYRQALLLDPAVESPAAIELKHHTKSARIVRASPHGDWIVSAADDGLACVWRITNGSPQPQPLVLSGHEANQPIESLAISSDGRWVVTGGWDNLVIAWDLQAADPVAAQVKLNGHNEDVMVVKITPDLRWIASASSDKSVRLWRMVDGRPATPAIELSGHDAELAKLEVSSDGRQLYSTDIENRIRRWDLTASEPASTGMELIKLPHRVRASAILPNGKWLATGGDNGNVAMLSLNDRSEPRVFESINEPIESLTIDAAGKRLLVGHADGRIYRWNLQPDGSLMNPQLFQNHGGPVVAIAISGDDSFAVSGSWDKTAAYWRIGVAGTPVPMKLKSGHGQVLSVAITPDNKWLVASCEDGTVCVWSAILCRVIQQALEEMGPRPKALTRVLETD